VQHREINRPLQIECVSALARQIANDFLKPHAFPQPPEHQIRPDLGDEHRLRLPGSMRVHHFDLFAVAQPSPHQAFKLAARLKDIEPPERSNDLLPHCLASPHTMGDLQVSVSFGGLDSEKHGSVLWTPHIHPTRQPAINNKMLNTRKSCTTFLTRTPPSARKPASIKDPYFLCPSKL